MSFINQFERICFQSLVVKDSAVFKSTVELRNKVTLTKTAELCGDLNLTGDMKITGATTLCGNQTVNGDVKVNGDTILCGSQTVNGAQTFNGNQTINGNETVNGNFKVNGTTTLCGDQTVTGFQIFNGDVLFCGKLETKGEVVIKDLKAPKNVFIIGPSTADTGNFAAYYPAVVASFTPVNSTIRKLIVVFNGREIALGPYDRHSEGWAMPDFLAKKMGYTLVNSCDITQTPTADCHVINYAVSGATAVGNVWNVPNNGTPFIWSNTTGPHGYNAQVALLLSHLSTASKIPTKNDVVIYNAIGGNDIGIIALTNAIAGGPAAAFAIGQFLATHINNIQLLYNAGFRHVCLDYFGANFLDYFPTFIKSDVAIPGTLAALKGLANTLFLGPSGLLQLLANQAAATMPELHLSFNDLAVFNVEVNINLSLHGFRTPMITDPDPRGSPATAPFPTQLGILAINANRCDANLVFIDDFHYTQLGQDAFSDHLCKFFLPWVV